VFTLNPFLQGVSLRDKEFILSNYTKQHSRKYHSPATIGIYLFKTPSEVKEIAYGLGITQMPCLSARVRMLELGIKKCSLCDRFKRIKSFGTHYCKSCNRTYNMKLRFRTQFRTLQRHSRQLGMDFPINRLKLKLWWRSTPDKCFYCGMTKKQYRTIKQALLKYNGKKRSVLRFKKMFLLEHVKELTIDRKSSNLGYKLNNIVKCCLFCNRIKGGFLNATDMQYLAPRIIGKLVGSLHLSV
jgi:hypothetical protein